MRLGLIAGNGRFPFLVLDAARAAGHDVTVVALKEETFPDLAEAASRPPAAAFHWISIGELGQCISLLKAARVSQAVMAGQVKHTKLFNVRPDWTLGRVLMRLATKNTDSLISGVADVLRDEGIDLIDSTALLAPLLAKAGVLTRRAPTDDEQSDLDFGCRVADAVAGLDIGQTIAVKSGAVVAGRGDGRHRRGHRPGGTARRPRRPDHQGREAESGHALRRAGCRRLDRRGDGRRRRNRAIGRRREDVDDRRRRDHSSGRRRRHLHRGTGDRHESTKARK
jgi:hypothetical protein